MRANLFLQFGRERLALPPSPELSPEFGHRDLLCGLYHLLNSRHGPSKFSELRRQLLASFRGEHVITCAALVLGRAPLRLHPALQKHALQGRIKSAFLNLEDILGRLLDMLRNPVAMHGPPAR